jgi:hypothetical protein
VPILAEPTADQRHAFELIGTTIPRPSSSQNNHNQNNEPPAQPGARPRSPPQLRTRSSAWVTRRRRGIRGRFASRVPGQVWWRCR